MDLADICRKVALKNSKEAIAYMEQYLMERSLTLEERKYLESAFIICAMEAVNKSLGGRK